MSSTKTTMDCASMVSNASPNRSFWYDRACLSKRGDLGSQGAQGHSARCLLPSLRRLSLRGFKDSEGAQHNFELREEVKRNTEALACADGWLLQLERLNEAMFGALSQAKRCFG